MRKLLLALLLSATPAIARDNGQYAAADPATSEWFKSLMIPGTKIPCCDEADGEDTQMDFRGDEVWATVRGEWMKVPPDTILKDTPNLKGHPIVWVYSTQGLDHVVHWNIRCFLPGALF